MKVIIVGGVAGGASCAARLRRLDEKAEILMVERGPYVSYANCGLPYHVSGVIEKEASLLVASEKLFHDQFAIDVRTHCEAVSISAKDKTVLLRNVLTGETTTESYDKLVLSPGAPSFCPPLPGVDLPGIFHVRTVPDARTIRQWIESGTTLLTGMANYTGMQMDNGGIEVQTMSGKTYPADIVIFAIGVRPETKLAQTAGIEIGECGGIRVSDSMQTSDPDIYAVGDAIEVKDFVTGKWSLVALAGPANRQGRIAADVIAGRDSKYRGTQGTSIIGLFGGAAAWTGASEKTLKRLGDDDYETPSDDLVKHLQAIIDEAFGRTPVSTAP
ncbi:NAD(P)/FAD-dependent oxidoreductase [Novipirellula artificiosorum]|uniref:Coenzyme A disulfide reductase n=1 Tax=Novipirellula artificiosorum TaxID=2528016 RepID=A0A5C6D7U8_9BACT|nr:FAD-dependent oxidoreductase [Novipirellula artificiosorum]TWU31306.1 Coenzyme A disulfide reductase [Novipirellula artificiosorum]